MDNVEFIDTLMDDIEEDYFNDDIELITAMYDRENHLKVQNYFSNIVLHYSLSDFKAHFRVTRFTFKLVLQKIGPCLVRRRNAPKVLPEKQFAMALWIFGNQEVYRSVADRFGCSKSTLWSCVFNVAFVLSNHVEDYLKWPERQFITNSKCIFKLLSFSWSVLQGICDHRLKFIDVFAGYCGSVHDARVWNNSDIKMLISNNIDNYLPHGTHLIGDSAYPLSKLLLTPYKDNGHLSTVQTNYNNKLCRTRVIIERAFEMIPLLILACCILHNICIDLEVDHFDINVPVEDILFIHDNVGVFSDGNEKRDIIANLLYS
ncbi:uncharacterized protein [Prorops nasuta]|uniref:uncharacterized protein n=1 Tax=Prorops nasuta TaxID=863751 RepID=UPI0034CE065F